VIAVTPRDPEYPPRLLDLQRAPDPLWIDGDPTALAAPAIAIVGTRRMTAYGERIARELAVACANAGIVVVSGLAQGIDSAAHRGVLDGGGRTVAVLGEGITLFLATIRGRRRPLVHRIRTGGAIVSEYAPNFCAQPWTFAKRNATVAALAKAIVIVEAGERSGALITAADARRLARPVYAVPGPLGSTPSVGTNALIAAGRARVLVSAEGLLADLGAPVVHARALTDPILDALARGPLDVDALSRVAGANDLSARLIQLLLAGSIVSTSDGRYRRR